MLDSARLADAELLAHARLTPAAVPGPDIELTKDEQRERIRAGIARDRAARQRRSRG